MNEHTRAAIRRLAAELAAAAPPMSADQARVLRGVFARRAGLSGPPRGRWAAVNRDEYEQYVAQRRQESQEIRREVLDICLGEMEAIQARRASDTSPDVNGPQLRAPGAGTTPAGGGEG